MAKEKKILVVAAHPDDEVLGCGGTMARLIDEGCDVCSFILSEGITSRDEKRDREGRKKDLEALKDQIQRANAILGVKKVFTQNFPDNRFDSVDLLDVVKEIEKVKNIVQPEVVFTQYGNDLNIDHQILYQAVLTATRPLEGEPVKEIYAFEAFSSTEWNYPLTFSPDIYFDISSTLDKKTEAMAAYVSEVRDFPHPRSLEGIRLNAQYWGMRTGLKYAEAFKAVRVLK